MATDQLQVYVAGLSDSGLTAVPTVLGHESANVLMRAAIVAKLFQRNDTESKKKT